jgi:hypothetical protein
MVAEVDWGRAFHIFEVPVAQLLMTADDARARSAQRPLGTKPTEPQLGGHLHHRLRIGHAKGGSACPSQPRQRT